MKRPMKSKTAWIAAALTVLLIPAQGLLAPAWADAFGFDAWGSFRVGPVQLWLGVHDGGPYAHRGPYYRFDRRVEYRGHRCGSACYVQRGVAFHHYNCPVALQHFRAYGVVPPRVGPYVDAWGRPYYRYEPPGRVYGRFSAPPPVPFRGQVYAPRWDARDRWQDSHRGRSRGHDKRDGHHRHGGDCRHR
jgi:hypothetical protein